MDIILATLSFIITGLVLFVPATKTPNEKLRENFIPYEEIEDEENFNY